MITTFASPRPHRPESIRWAGTAARWSSWNFKPLWLIAGSCAARFEHELSSRVTRRFSYLPFQSRRPESNAAPILDFLLTIPTVVSRELQKQEIKVIAWLVSSDDLTAYLKTAPFAQRITVCDNPEVMRLQPSSAWSIAWSEKTCLLP